VLGLAVAGLAGLAVATTSAGPLTLSAATFAACTVLLEVLRRRADPPVPWWTAHVVVLPWAAIVLVPWAYYARQGGWTLLGVPISPSLTHTWTVHLLALVGLTAGSVLALWVSRKDHSPEVGGVDWTRVSFAIGLAMVCYLLSFLVAQRPLGALWRLSGSIRYFDNPDQATGLGILDYMTTIATGVLLVAAALRRRDRPRPPLTEVAWLLVLAVITLGSGARGRFYLVVVGWLLIQSRPLFARASTAGRVALTTVGAVLLVVAISLAGTISVLRTRGAGIQAGTSINTAITGLDVISSSELLVARGGTPGVLGGRSYTEFPKLLVPRRFAGGEKISPSADNLMRERLDPTAGFSAPFWIEPMLNFGMTGVFLFSLAIGGLAVAALRRSADRVGDRFAACVYRLGPVWVLLGYLALSRLTALQLSFTVGSVIIGVLVGSRCVSPAPATAPAESPSLPAR
jgi:hypothetical protein